MEIRRLKAEEFEQAIHLSNRTFREQGHTSMGQAFPHVFSKELQQSFGAFDGETLISFIGLVPATIRIGEATLTVFSLGSVCTHEDYRQRGISTNILQEIYDYINQAAASLLFVSGDRGLYMRNHCYHFGKSFKYSIGKSSINKGGYDGDIRKGQSADVFQIDRIRQEHRVRFDSSIMEWQILLEAGGYASIFKMEQALYVASRDGVLEGYAVIGMPTPKSTKEHAIIIEWGGDPRIVYGIVQHLLENDIVLEMELTLPWHDKFRDEISEHPCEEQNNEGTIHIVDVERLIGQLMPYLYEKDPTIAQSLSVRTLDEEIVTINHFNATEITVSLEEFVKLLFDPQSLFLGRELQTIFPIPLPNTEGMYFV
ncbi:GNAT family N-acetyltransferase [Sporosarcina sp. ANT_H38]|uniref:GNAT family N-acetyltransferase n=1 Tax=Sporosarcina sp. ANT_H38 TaxID=2597358 RepID=UPI0011F2ABE9|nr:GNAT family N-acetyltransferase [Sporosarcina sp. ANT_H38]KAA0965565.1 GNAT family N-acetyltransferase [Sporosarcina sp. ANT_H38]